MYVNGFMENGACGNGLISLSNGACDGGSFAETPSEGVEECNLY